MEETMSDAREVWHCDDDREDLWETDPERAARLAYVEMVGLWDKQVEQGEYRGVPNFNAPKYDASIVELRGEDRTTPSTPRRVTPDSSAGMWMVPGRVRERWNDVA